MAVSRWLCAGLVTSAYIRKTNVLSRGSVLASRGIAVKAIG